VRLVRPGGLKSGDGDVRSDESKLCLTGKAAGIFKENPPVALGTKKLFHCRELPSPPRRLPQVMFAGTTDLKTLHETRSLHVATGPVRELHFARKNHSPLGIT
jgi:hypothetical protein